MKTASTRKEVSAPSFLRVMRERRKMSRTELSKRTKLSAYQVEGLEGKNTENLLSRLRLCVEALGYKLNDLLNLMDVSCQNDICSKGTLGKPHSETIIEDGVKWQSYAEDQSIFLSHLQLAKGKSIGKEKFPATDVIFGLIREGTLLVDMLTHQIVYKKDQFFIMRKDSSFKLVNACPYTEVSVLLFALRHPLK